MCIGCDTGLLLTGRRCRLAEKYTVSMNLTGVVLFEENLEKGNGSCSLEQVSGSVENEKEVHDKHTRVGRSLWMVVIVP